MSQSLTDIAQQLKNNNKKVQLIYAFNGSGKTRLSREFKEVVAPKSSYTEDSVQSPRNKIIYYNAFTEDLFSWDNDLENDADPKLTIQANTFTDWILKDQGQDPNITANFQNYTDEKLTPHFSSDFADVRFSFERGDDTSSGYIKISKGEESCFIWSIFFSLMEQIIEALNVADPSDRDTDQFNQLEYVFIDDPVSSLDENHLIELAVDIARLIKSSESDVKFVITTHNPLFYNVLHNELKQAAKYCLKKYENGGFDLTPQSNDSPFSYHLHLKSELENAISTGQLSKYHFNFFRNILEKTSTFIGSDKWGDLLPEVEEGRDNPYARIINIYSHSKYSTEEVIEVQEEHKRVLGFLVKKLDEMYQLKMRAE